MNFLGGIKTYVTAGLIVLLVLAGSTATIQTMRLKDQAETSRTLRQEIRNMNAAIALTDRLRKDNARLTQERDDLLRGLSDAEGASIPLSDDLLRIIGRLRGESPTSPSTPR